MSRLLGTLFSILIACSTNAQTPGNFNIRLSSAIGSGWWIYTLGTGAGIDRTDNEPKVSFEAELVYQLKKFAVGVGSGYSFLADNTMEEFQDTRTQRSKYYIADESVKFWEYYLLAEYHVYTSDKYVLGPQFKFGSFRIDTTHPQQDNFGLKLFYELSVTNQMYLSENLNILVRPFYQVMTIDVREELLPGEKHRIFSLGLALGLKYGF